MSRFKRDMGMIFTGLALGVALTGGAIAAGITAEPSWSPIYVDGRQVQMTAYNIAGNNYVKLRDIGQAVGFNVYYQGGVQVDSGTPYTGEAPVKVAAQTSPATAERAVRVNCYKDCPLQVGDSSALMIYPSGTTYTVTSSNPAIVRAERAMDQFWKVVAVAPGTAEITAVSSDGATGSVMVTVEGESQGKSASIDLAANMGIRQEMIRLINDTRRTNGVGELTVNTALMNAAQHCSAQMFWEHHTEYECKAAMAYGYPHGFGNNLTCFSGDEYMENVARTAVTNWINSSGHFQTMIDPDYDTLGVGVTIDGGKAYCYMFAGNPNGHHPYE